MRRANFETSFTEAYGTQELSSIPIDAGQSKDIKLKVRPPSTIDAGHFPVQVTVKAEDASAKTELALDVVGQPQLTVSGRDGLLSARAVAGAAKLDPDRRHQHRHARRPTMSSCPRAHRPAGKSTFEPATIDRLVPGKDAEVQALVTPSDKSLAGDYMTTIRATSRGENASGQFRDHGRDLDGLGHGGRRHDRRGAAVDARRGGEVRTPMSNDDSNAATRPTISSLRRGVSPSAMARSASSTPSTSTSPRARCSGCSARTAPARPRRS